MDKGYNNYDVVIIGAGIGGLVCGCYLAKYGKKVLILEKNSYPGGCCSSFIKKGFQFDMAAHSLGGMSPKGPIGSVLMDLGIKDVNISRSNPAYILQVGEYRVDIRDDFTETINALKKDFKRESSRLEDFCRFVRTATAVSLIKLKDLTFQELMDRYFIDERLKAILYSPLLGNTGVSPLEISTFTAIKFYQQYILDGGYHLDGGMQDLPNLLTQRFRELGGEIQLSVEVDNILVEKNVAIGVKTKNGAYYAKNVVSNIDTRKTFLELISSGIIDSEFVNLLNGLRPSSSMYVCYIGLKKGFDCELTSGITYWFVSDYDIKRIYRNIADCKLTFDWVSIRLSQNKESLQIFTIAPLMDETYWRDNDLFWKEGLLKRIFEIIPGLSSWVDLLLTANPRTIEHWTANYRGAACGWESTPDQFSIPGLSQRTMIKNLYLTGHWTTLTLGIPGVVNIGKSAAKMILLEK